MRQDRSGIACVRGSRIALLVPVGACHQSSIRGASSAVRRRQAGLTIETMKLVALEGHWGPKMDFTPTNNEFQGDAS
jgi:hypothetical protein